MGGDCSKLFARTLFAPTGCQRAPELSWVLQLFAQA